MYNFFNPKSNIWISRRQCSYFVNKQWIKSTYIIYHYKKYNEWAISYGLWKYNITFWSDMKFKLSNTDIQSIFICTRRKFHSLPTRHMYCLNIYQSFVIRCSDIVFFFGEGGERRAEVEGRFFKNKFIGEKLYKFLLQLNH